MAPMSTALSHQTRSTQKRSCSLAISLKTFSQSDGQSARSTQELNQSRPPTGGAGGVQTSSEMSCRSLSPQRLRVSGQSLGLTYSFESEETFSGTDAELRRLAGSGPLKMSVTIPSTGQDEESEDLSEIDITDPV